MQYLTFRLNAVEYAVDVRIIDTVVEYEGATAVPTPLPYMRGVMELRGQVIPLIDLRKKLGLAVLDDLRGSSVVIFRVGGTEPESERKPLTVGAIVDGVSEVLTIDESRIETAAEGGTALWAGYVNGIARLEGRMVVVIQPEGLFSLEELRSLRTA